MACLERVVRSCPNINSLVLLTNQYHDANPCIWNTLLIVSCPQLTRLNVNDACFHIHTAELCKLLKAISSSLQELCIKNVNLTTVLNALDRCQQLRHLEISVDDVAEGRLVKRFSSCKAITSLSLHWMLPTIIFVVELILDTCQQHMAKSSQNIRVYWQWTSTWPFTCCQSNKELAHLLEKHPSLVYVQFERSAYNSESKHLDLLFTDGSAVQDLEDLDRIIRACDGMQFATFHHYVENDNAYVRVHCTWRQPSCSAEDIVHLNLAGMTHAALQSNEFRVKLNKFYSLGEVVRELTSIAQSCPNIERLELPNAEANILQVTDATMIALLTSCRKLKILRLDGRSVVTFRTLQAIVDHMLSNLKLLLWTHADFEEEDVRRFEMLAKERGLLPVPRTERDL